MMCDKEFDSIIHETNDEGIVNIIDVNTVIGAIFSY